MHSQASTGAAERDGSGSGGFPNSGEILVLGRLHGRAKIHNLFTNELRYETYLFGQALLPLARDEHGREVLALSSGSLSDCHLTFFGLTDNARSP